MLRIVDPDNSVRDEANPEQELVELHELLIRAERNPLLPRHTQRAVGAMTDLIESYVSDIES